MQQHMTGASNVALTAVCDRGGACVLGGRAAGALDTAKHVRGGAIKVVAHRALLCHSRCIIIPLGQDGRGVDVVCARGDILGLVAGNQHCAHSSSSGRGQHQHQQQSTLID